MELKDKKMSWIILISMLVLVVSLMVTWVAGFGDSLAYDRTHGQPANLPLSGIQTGFQELGKLWNEKTRTFFGTLTTNANTNVDDQQEGRVLEQTNAGLTNDQIDSIQTNLFENTAPQQ